MSARPDPLAVLDRLVMLATDRRAGGHEARQLRADIAALVEAATLVRDLTSQEWQEADGTRRAATDNSGKRMWFIGDDLMQSLRAALAPFGDPK